MPQKKLMYRIRSHFIYVRISRFFQYILKSMVNICLHLYRNLVLRFSACHGTLYFHTSTGLPWCWPDDSLSHKQSISTSDRQDSSDKMYCDSCSDTDCLCKCTDKWVLDTKMLCVCDRRRRRLPTGKHCSRGNKELHIWSTFESSRKILLHALLSSFWPGTVNITSFNS